jgi:hypothetical protein
MKPSLKDYVIAAFNARPSGMFVPPNWIGLGAILLLSLVEPAFLLLGVGLELGYLNVLSSSPRFRRVVDGLFLGSRPLGVAAHYSSVVFAPVRTPEPSP